MCSSDLFPAWTPVIPRALLPDEGGDVFGAIADRDVLLHHPYDSFTGTISAFIEAAAVDPHVVTIKQTLYRTSAQESRIIRALIRAAESGKQVVALVELKARFDEETNLGYAEALERAGVHVVYGIVGLKAHAKLALVVRREGGALRTYSHVGTGNYNAVTSRTYEDLGLLTADANIGADLTDTFNLLTGYGHWTGRHTVLLAPYELREALAALIRSQASPGGRVVMKMNSLVDPDLIEALHDVSRAGGTVDLAALEEILVRFSELVLTEYPSIQEIDINPLLATPDGVVALDAPLRIDRRIDPRVVSVGRVGALGACPLRHDDSAAVAVGVGEGGLDDACHGSVLSGQGDAQRGLIGARHVGEGRHVAQIGRAHV